MFKNNRIGRFKVTLDLIDDIIEGHQQNILFSDMVIVRAETLHYEGIIEYVAICNYFEEKPDGFMVPDYEILFKKENGNITRIIKKSKYG